MTEATKQLVSEPDRETLRDYLTKRWKHARKEIKHANSQAEAAYAEALELEIMFAFDELLGEEPPDFRKKPRAH